MSFSKPSSECSIKNYDHFGNILLWLHGIAPCCTLQYHYITLPYATTLYFHQTTLDHTVPLPYFSNIAPYDTFTRQCSTKPHATLLLRNHTRQRHYHTPHCHCKSVTLTSPYHRQSQTSHYPHYTLHNHRYTFTLQHLYKTQRDHALPLLHAT